MTCPATLILILDNVPLFVLVLCAGIFIGGLIVFAHYEIAYRFDLREARRFDSGIYYGMAKKQGRIKQWLRSRGWSAGR